MLRSWIILLFLLVGFSKTMAQDLVFEASNWAETVEKAQNEKKLIFLDAYTSWCGPCKLMEKKVFVNKDVIALFNQSFINLKMDMEEGEGPAIAEEFEIYAYPTLLFFDPQSNSVKSLKIGYKDPEELIAWAKEQL